MLYLDSSYTCVCSVFTAIDELPTEQYLLSYIYMFIRYMFVVCIYELLLLTNKRIVSVIFISYLHLTTYIYSILI